MTNVSSSNGLMEITEESVNVEYPRPLKFDPEKHKMLNSEFKYLYTAITRARVNVWFYDEDKEARAPIFEYFRRLGLVQVVALEDQERETGQLTSMFAVKSTPEEWRKKGMRSYKKGLWVVAVECFRYAGDTLMLQKSQAQQQAAEAMKLRYMNGQQMRDKFLHAGESFLQCAMYDEAEICLNNAREFKLLAKLYEKREKYRDAALLFKKIRFPLEASRCYESQNNYHDAIETLCLAGRTDEAINVLERYNLISSGDLEGRHGIIPPRSTRTVERLYHQLADQHFKGGNLEEMEKVLQYLPTTTDRIAFLKKRRCIIPAARIMEKEGRRDEAARLRDEGQIPEGVKYSNAPRFTADCLVSPARFPDSRFKVGSSSCEICGTNFFKATMADYQLPISHEDNKEYSQENSQQPKGTLQDKEIETAEAHKRSQSHFQKEQEFQRYKELYFAEIRPRLVKADDLYKVVEGISKSGFKIRMEELAFDFERLETSHSTVKTEVQTIESSLNWTNTSSLMSAVKELETRVQQMYKLLEQAKYKKEEELEDIKEKGGDDDIRAINKDVPKKRQKRKRKK